MSRKKYWEAQDTGSSDGLTPSLSRPPPRPSTWEQPLGVRPVWRPSSKSPGAQGARSSGVCGLRHGGGEGRGGEVCRQLCAIRLRGLQGQTAAPAGMGRGRARGPDEQARGALRTPAGLRQPRAPVHGTIGVVPPDAP